MKIPYYSVAQQSGQALVEYVILLSLISVIAIGIISVFGDEVAAQFQTVNDCISDSSTCHEVVQSDTSSPPPTESNSSESEAPPETHDSSIASSSTSTANNTSVSEANRGTENSSTTSSLPTTDDNTVIVVSDLSTTNSTSSESNVSSSNSAPSSVGEAGFIVNTDTDVNTFRQVVSLVSTDPDVMNENTFSLETQCRSDIHFDDFASDVVLNEQIVGVSVSTHDLINAPATIFDASAINPNVSGNVLAIADNTGLSENRMMPLGGQLEFTFDTPVTIGHLNFLDLDNPEIVTVQLYDASAIGIKRVDTSVLTSTIENSTFRVELNATDVHRMLITSVTETALSSVIFCGSEPTTDLINIATETNHLTTELSVDNSTEITMNVTTP